MNLYNQIITSLNNSFILVIFLFSFSLLKSQTLTVDKMEQMLELAEPEEILLENNFLFHSISVDSSLQVVVGDEIKTLYTTTTRYNGNNGDNSKLGDWVDFRFSYFIMPSGLKIFNDYVIFYYTTMNNYIKFRISLDSMNYFLENTNYNDDSVEYEYYKLNSSENNLYSGYTVSIMLNETSLTIHRVLITFTPMI